MWDLEQYEKFDKERSLSFFDLLELIEPMPNMRVLDLGCGSGALTRGIHQAMNANYTLGIDSSPEMLKKSHIFKNDQLDFQQIDIRQFSSPEPFHLIFSHAALQWVPDHRSLLPKITQYLKPNGQIAIQMPANQDYATHLIAEELAHEPPFKDVLGPKYAFPLNVLKIEDYSQLLYQLGFKRQMVRLQVYLHELESTESLVEWVKGSVLTYYRSLLPQELYSVFVDQYTPRVMKHFGDQKPFPFPIKRVLIWGRLEGEKDVSQKP